jgi:hypothetical protein
VIQHRFTCGFWILGRYKSGGQTCGFERDELYIPNTILKNPPIQNGRRTFGPFGQGQIALDVQAKLKMIFSENWFLN